MRSAIIKKEQYLLFGRSQGVNLVINCLIDGSEIGVANKAFHFNSFLV